jgi:hypothetical protein
MQRIFDKKLNEFKSQIPTSTTKNTSGVLLFKDYLVRMNKYYQTIGIIEKWGSIFRTDISHNLVYIIAPELLENIISLDNFKNSLLTDGHFDRSRQGLDIPILYAYLCWEVCKNNDQLNIYRNLPNPYEPVIKILARGNHIKRGEMATIEIDILPVFKNLDFTKTFLPSYNTDFLNYIDEVSERSGSRGIPNIEKTNELWEEFQKLKLKP